MSYGTRVLAAFGAVSIIALLPAQDNSQKEPTPKELYMRSRQLPYHVSEDDKTGQTPTKGKDTPTGKKGKGHPRDGSGVKSPENLIGIKYAVLKRDDDGKPVEVPTNTEFHTDDRIKVTVEVNASGYLYILNQGPAGKWDFEFPSPAIESRDNRVSAGRRVTLPPEKYMQFYAPAGVERLIILFARKPEVDLEKAIEKARADAKQAKSSTDDAAVPDDVMTKKREMYSRDLRIEEAPPTPDNQPKDNSTYAVNINEKSDAHVCVEVRLVHK
jgi:hypothetical protein